MKSIARLISKGENDLGRTRSRGAIIGEIMAAVAVLALLQGCATLPASGPTARVITHGARAGNELNFKLLDVDAATLADINKHQVLDDITVATLRSIAADGRNDAVGPGDQLAISIYEVGVGLFGVNRTAAGGFDPSARGESLTTVVDSQGRITLPYVGSLDVTGRTTGDVQNMIVSRLRGLSQNPQAIVSIKENVSNSVYVAGDVRKPGRMQLTLLRERLLDAIALAGGASYSAEDTLVRVNRGGRTVEERLGRIRPGSEDDLLLLPGDRVELEKHPRSFIVLGATEKVSQIPFEIGDISLAEAVARAGGPTDSAADPSAIFIFRYVRSATDSTKEEPVVYRLNMMKPASYFLAQRFAIHDKDVLYFANAAANQPAKLVTILNQLFSPFLTARALTRP